MVYKVIGFILLRQSLKTYFVFCFMVDGNYSKILERISKLSGLSLEEVDRKIEAKRSRLSGLISKEGAAQVVAAELGVSFDNEELKLDELLPGMKKVKTCGKVFRIFPVREFKSKNGQTSKVVNFFIADEKTNVKVVLWDLNHVSLIEDRKITEGVVVEIENASVRDNEIHLGSFSNIKISNKDIENTKTERVTLDKSISEFRIGDRVSLNAFVVQSFEPRFFYTCPDCGKKAVSGEGGFICDEHGRVKAIKKALLNIFLDDGTETIKAVVFNDNLSALGFSDLNDAEKTSFQREDLLGKELNFVGNVKMNSFFNTPELVIEDIAEINLDKLIAILEK